MTADETVVLDDELDGLEELAPEVDGEAEPAGKAKAEKTPARPKIEFGAAWLAAQVTEATGVTHDGKAVRTILRSLAAKGQIAREPGARYEFTGADDPTVQLVVDAAKAALVAKTARAAQPKGSRKPAATDAPAPAVVDEDAPVEDLGDLDDLDEPTED